MQAEHFTIAIAVCVGLFLIGGLLRLGGTSTNLLRAIQLIASLCGIAIFGLQMAQTMGYLPA